MNDRREAIPFDCGGLGGHQPCICDSAKPLMSDDLVQRLRDPFYAPKLPPKSSAKPQSLRRSAHS